MEAHKINQIPTHEDFEPDENPPLIDFDFQTGKFNLKTIHPSLKKIFKTIGITKKDLKDIRMVPIIFDGLIKAFSELHRAPPPTNVQKKKIKQSFDITDETLSDKEKNEGNLFNSPKNLGEKTEEKPCVIKFDLNTGVFEIETLHPTLKRIFKKAKITKKDLRNKEMAITIMNAIIESFCEMHNLSESKEMLSEELLKY